MVYTWHIFSLGLKDQTTDEGVLLEDIVVRVKWKKTAKDENGASSSYVGETLLSLNNLTSSQFIPFSDVKKEDVIAWLEEAIPAGQMNRIHGILENKINKSRIKNYQTPQSWR